LSTITYKQIVALHDMEKCRYWPNHFWCEAISYTDSSKCRDRNHSSFEIPNEEENGISGVEAASSIENILVLKIAGDSQTAKIWNFC